MDAVKHSKGIIYFLSQIKYNKFSILESEHYQQQSTSGDMNMIDNNLLCSRRLL